MTSAQGDVSLLQDPVAQALLASRQPAHLAYTWQDGTPRVVPMWFTWTGQAIVFGTPANAPKVGALRQRSEVAVTIDDAGAWPYRALLVRGTAAVDLLDDAPLEYVQAADRYFGSEQGPAWVSQLMSQLQGQQIARVAVTPTWAAILDFETRFPSALSA